MLINYTVNNYLSFKNENTLSLETGERLRKYPENTMKITTKNNSIPIELLKNVIIFGSNGSGKSNLLSSLNMMKQMISNIPLKATTKLPKRSFMLDNYSKDTETLFEIEIIQNNYQYKYMFEFNRESILKEKLEILEKNNYVTYFERTNTNTYTVIPNHLKPYTTETRGNILFLQKAQDNNDQVSIELMKWFEESLVFFSKNNSEELFYLLKNEPNKKRFLEFMKLADLNMIDVVVETSTKKVPEELINALSNMLSQLNNNNIPEELPSEQIMENLYTIYKKYDHNGNVIGTQRIPLGMESSGTKKIIYLALNILFCQEKNKVLILDEFDDAFHEELASALINVFNSKNSKTQVIVTSHELNLMDKGLRKDQIYFVQKDFSGESELYSIFDFDDVSQTRGDIGYYKRYMKGAFGAKPNINTDNLLEFMGKEY